MSHGVTGSQFPEKLLDVSPWADLLGEGVELVKSEDGVFDFIVLQPESAGQATPN